ncbi:tRNA (N(6)-L-threonylcarbamoyladenosine(37)-C(2))-methylthiotransferase MtaB [Hyphococcus sp.]|uniref:tRNA (N(6)-L-threonylcarbamoyladenosine(37)-C(2))- methylthiotransferase MtaB n=1 Tax=Hyphococcus sp. TaxID=2038636 RepID=UPI0035C760BF
MADADFITLGCRLNAAESETMRRLAAGAGVADAVIVNTCAVTNEAVRSARQRIRRAKRERPDARIIVTGCAAQTEAHSFAEMPEVSAVIGNQEKLDAAQWVALADADVSEDGDIIRVNDIMSARETAGHMIDGYGDRARAFLQIQNGCDHRCTFCIIPYGRGNSRSAPVAHVVDQARKLVDAGHRELVLTGVDITSWGADLDGGPRLGALVAALLDRVPALYRLRLSSIDGAEIDDELFERITGDERVAPHLHLSLQSGDNMILKRMKRRHSREQAIDLCQRVRAARPHVAFGADIIAGFPTETEDMFENSLAIVDEAGLSWLHVFPFSPRQGTPAARMPQLPRGEVKARAARLREKGEAAEAALLEGLIGRTEDAILESGGRARLGNFAPVRVTATGQVGDILKLRITGVESGVLTGEAA